MESPLDVLSRVATMMQNSESPGSPMKRELDSPPARELPTKIAKYHRMRERRASPPISQRSPASSPEQRCVSPPPSSSPPPHDEGRGAQHRKCVTAGTQTAFSSFTSNEGYPVDLYHPTHRHSDPSYHVLDLDSDRGQGHKGHALPASQPASLPMYHPSLSHRSSAHQSSCKDDEEDVAPLNLSKNSPSSRHDSPSSRHNSPPSRHDSSQQCYGDISPGHESSPRSGREPSPRSSSVVSLGYPASHPRRSLSPPHHAQQAVHGNAARGNSEDDMCDPDIEEHFRRSLGVKYPRIMTPQSSPSPEPRLTPPAHSPSSPQQNATDSSVSPVISMSVIGAVDDHFAKSLGATWTALKEAAAQPEEEDPLSVDDHFAKALGGETWRRIKAEKQGQSSRGASPVPLSAHASPRHGSPLNSRHGSPMPQHS